MVPITRSSCVYFDDNTTLTKLSFYPVGVIYQSTGSTSPASLFGGDWERLYDKFLVGAGNTYGVGTTGGEASHMLTNPELPTHHHYFANTSYTLGNGGTGYEGNMNLVIGGYEDYIVCFYNGPLGRPNAAFVAATQQDHTLGAGDNVAHNNLPPYYAVNIWRRTA